MCMATTGKCPVCGKASDDKYRPFCCKRCADVDLGRWFSGSYAIPVEVISDDEESSDYAPQEDGGV
jgi:uncharacterized protein